MFFSPLNQGREGTCVGHGCKHWALITPVVQTTPTAEPTARALYLRATQLDAWPENDLDPTSGTSVVAGMLALREAGFLEKFHWEYTAEGAARWLGGKSKSTGRFIGGPMVLGVNWYDSMYEVDVDGYINIPTFARLAGGHCLAVDEVNLDKEYVSGPNSWGYNFGKYDYRIKRRNGRWRMRFNVLQRLLDEDGELAAATEVKRHVLAI